MRNLSIDDLSSELLSDLIPADVADNLRQYLAAAFGVENHPKEEKLWNLAWDYGHSNGYYEVYYYYADLVELIK